MIYSSITYSVLQVLVKGRAIHLSYIDRHIDVFCLLLQFKAYQMVSMIMNMIPHLNCKNILINLVFAFTCT